jgi:hypothetical protein
LHSFVRVHRRGVAEKTARRIRCRRTLSQSISVSINQ